MKIDRVSFPGLVILTMLTFIGCGRSGTPAPAQDKTSASSSAAQKSGEGAESQRSAEWVTASKQWPDTLRWTFDSASEHTQDGFFMRLVLNAAQDFIPGQYNDTHPLQCVANMTIRPVPSWPLARGLVLDSIVFHDPIRNKTLPGLPMKPTDRAVTGQTIRSGFATVMKNPYVPSLTENQLLQPMAYFHWDKRIIIGTLDPINVKFIRTIQEGEQ